MPRKPDAEVLFGGQETLPAGMLAPGNIDLYAQPEVRNPDGSTSTVDSVGVNLGGREYLLPTVTPDGRHFVNEVRKRKLPEAQVGGAVVDLAVAEYRKTGRHLGIFKTPEAGDAYAKQLHQDYEAGKYRKRPGGSNAQP